MLFTVLMRRSMMRVAEKLSVKYGADALITGESLAQVASQTLKAIVCTDAAQELPVLRPLIGMDKSEITEIARKSTPTRSVSSRLRTAAPSSPRPIPRPSPRWRRSSRRRRRCRSWAALEEAAAENAEKIHIE